ncbi:MAG: B12-binding domain-containing radical SAM protein [archaeon]
MARIKVLPVYPRFPESFWGFRRAIRYIGKDALSPPTGLLTAMAMFPEDEFDVQPVADLNVEPLTDRQIANADLIATSTMIIQENSHNDVLRRAHARGKKIVAGGPFPTSYPERNSGADFIVAGEAELTLPPFLEDILGGRPQPMYAEESVAGRTHIELARNGKPLLTSTPLPRWELLDLRRYASVGVQYSRGCPFDCEFCDITKLFGRESRTKTPEQMTDEFDAVLETGFDGSAFIVDDNFIGNRARVRHLLPALKAWQEKHGYPYPLNTEASTNLAWLENRDILEGMVGAGFTEVFVGFETDDRESLKKMGKTQNLRMDPREAVRKIQEAGLEVTGGFIVGSDGERPGGTKRLYDFAQETGVVIPMVGLLSALKGTRLYNRLEQEGRLRGIVQGSNTHHLGFNFEPEQDERELLEGYKTLLTKLFDPENYYARDRVLQKNLGQRRPSSKINLEGVIALGKSLATQLFARGGIEYARHLIQTAATNPRYFPEAVSKAIRLKHLRDITDEMLRAEDYVPQVETLYEQFVAGAREISERYGGNIRKQAKLISKAAREALERAERGYERLHKDFRASRAGVALENLRGRIQEELARYNTHSVPD